MDGILLPPNIVLQRAIVMKQGYIITLNGEIKDNS